ncbi:MAG: glycosyltransferase family 2 protein [Candidatus Limiplasma sp.]|nr:glycosyltransferase family 2 protein [Candidatus Limiplasma sp.]
MIGKRKSPGPIQDVLTEVKKDRRLLPNVPCPDGARCNIDRRGQREVQSDALEPLLNPSLPEHRGVRYVCDHQVHVLCRVKGGKTRRFVVSSVDISTAGILLRLSEAWQRECLKNADQVTLRFTIEPGTMPESYEMKVRTKARVTSQRVGEDGLDYCGLEFSKSLVYYAYRKRGRMLRYTAVFGLLLMSALVILMRVGSHNVFEQSKILYGYGLATAFYLLTRYLFGALYKPTPVNENYMPPVSIIIPCFNEEEWIQRTILSCLNQDYPTERLEVIVVDDCSTDRSVEKIEEVLQELYEKEAQYNVRERVRFLRQKVNAGKREAMAAGVRIARHGLVVFVDSDSFLDPYAVIHLVQPFQDPKVAGVSGRTAVANSFTNFITKIQAVRYDISFRVMKAAEGYFDAVGCLSGPLSCYRKDVLLAHMDAWLKQTFLGRRATFGDDRSMTNFILRKHRTCYQDTAICSTIVPNTHRMFLKQQMRWKRSWLRESTIACTFMWKKEPLMALSFYFGFLIPVLAPIVVTYNLFYVPFFHGLAPITFLLGIFVMSMMMSLAQLLFRRSSIWFYGIFYSLYHIGILMWQMPVAWVTFWKSTWGTRMTPSDVAEAAKRVKKGTPPAEKA